MTDPYARRPWFRADDRRVLGGLLGFLAFLAVASRFSAWTAFDAHEAPSVAALATGCAWLSGALLSGLVLARVVAGPERPLAQLDLARWILAASALTLLRGAHDEEGWLAWIAGLLALALYVPARRSVPENVLRRPTANLDDVS